MAEALPQEPVPLKVSVIFIAYNQIGPLRESLEALERAHARETFEVLVVDPGSQDGSSEVDAQFPSTSILRLPHYFGATKAMNIASRTAKGEYVFFLAPGAIVEPDTISKLVALLDDDSGLGGVCPLLVDSQGRTASRAFRTPDAQAFRNGLVPMGLDVSLKFESEAATVEYPCRDALMVRRQFIQGMNFLDERYGEYWADLDLAMQIRRGLKKIRVYPSIQVTLTTPLPELVPTDPALVADRTLGASVFLGKYYGFVAGFGFKLSAILSALFGFRLKEFGALVSGKKIDGI